MYIFNTGDLSTVMDIPVPFRKWFIRRWNKQKEAEMKNNEPDIGSDTSKPLTPQEKSMLRKKHEGFTRKETKNNLDGFLNQMKNRQL